MKTKKLSWANREKVNQRKVGEKQDFAGMHNNQLRWSASLVGVKAQDKSLREGLKIKLVYKGRENTSQTSYINKVQDE